MSLIWIEGEEFRAPHDAPYAEALAQAGWRLRKGEHWFTMNVEFVEPFVEHLEPEIQEVLLGVHDAYKASSAVETDFVAEVPDGEKLEPFQIVDV